MRLTAGRKTRRLADGARDFGISLLAAGWILLALAAELAAGVLELVRRHLVLAPAAWLAGRASPAIGAASGAMKARARRLRGCAWGLVLRLWPAR